MKRSSRKFTRRRFLMTAMAAGAALESGCKSGPRSRWQFFSDKEARTLAALCDQIIPEDDFPSASQADVVNYIDIQLMHHFRRYQDDYTEGLRLANRISRDRFGHDLPEALPQQRAQAAQTMAESHAPFFDMLRDHTMQGYYGAPRHGGNRNAVSWHMLGLAEPPVRGRAQYDFTSGGRS